MKLVQINWNPGRRQLRQFGAICLVALPVVGWMWGGGTTLVATLALVGAILALVGMLAPKILKPLFLVLTVAATPIGMVIGELTMLLIYFGVFWPVGMIFRITQRDALQLRRDRTRTSYWQPKRRPADVTSYYRQS